MTPIDPAHPFPLDPAGRDADHRAGLGRRAGVLERRGAAPAVGDGPPTADPATLPEGTPYLDRVNLRAYYVLAGAWRHATLT